MTRTFIVLRKMVQLLPFLMLGCATEHVPIIQTFHFPKAPDAFFSSERLLERVALEQDCAQRSKSDRPCRAEELYRLNQLFQKEARYGQPLDTEASPTLVKSMLEGASSDIESLESEVSSLRNDVQATAREIAREKNQSEDQGSSHATFQKRYLEVVKTWNRDENAVALQQATALVEDSAFVDSLSGTEKERLLNLRFRIALDALALQVAEETYRSLLETNPCSVRTREAGFLLALHWFVGGRERDSINVLNSQCLVELNPYLMARQSYWLARFLESSNPEESRRVYLELAGNPIPTYYGILAFHRLKEPLPTIPNWQKYQHLKDVLLVPSSVSNHFLQAEKWLGYSLRTEAEWAIRRAVQKLLRSGPENHPRALLYAAHLHLAAGYPLDAMQVYTQVSEALQKEPRLWSQVSPDFVLEMFPHPTQLSIESFSDYWKADNDFLMALVRQESAFNPGAISPAGARGLGQLMPFLGEQIATGWGFNERWERQQLFHSFENLKLAAFHIRTLSDLFSGQPALVAAAYNAGIKRVSQWKSRFGSVPMDIFIELIPVEETRNYVKLVLRNYAQYRRLRVRKPLTTEFLALDPPPPSAG